MIAIFMLIRPVFLNDARNKIAFVSLAVSVIDIDLIAFALIRPQLFRFSTRVVRDDSIRGIQYGGGRTIVLLQQNRLRLRIIILKVQNVANICTAPAINRLIAIPYYTYIVMCIG